MSINPVNYENSQTPVQTEIPNPLTSPGSEITCASLPNELILKIFSYLNRKALSSCYGVSKKFKYLMDNSKYTNFQSALVFVKKNPTHLEYVSKDLLKNKKFILALVDQNPGILAQVPAVLKADKAFMMSLVNAFAFGKDKWEKYFGPIDEEPALPANIVSTLCATDRYDTTTPLKKVCETHMLVLVPSAVNGKKFNLNTLRKLVKKPLMGHKTDYDFYNQLVERNTGRTTPAQSQWVLMTKNLIPDSQGKSYREQRGLVAKNSKYKVPDILSVTVGILTNYVRTEERLLTDAPWKCTRCREYCFGGQMIVGGFSSNGLWINYNNYDIDYVGVMALRYL